MGCAKPEGATGGNIARQIALRAGCRSPCRASTVNRFCSSGLQTIAMAAQRVIAGEGEVFVAGGVESISCVQNEMNQHMLADAWLNAAQARDLLADAADRRERGQALRHRRGSAGRVRRAQPAARRGRAGRGPLRRRDRADDGDHGRGRQGHRRSCRARRSRSPPTRASAPTPRSKACARSAGDAGRRDHRRQRQPVLRRRVGLRGDEREARGAARPEAARHLPRLRGRRLRARRDGHRPGVRGAASCWSAPASRSRTSTCGS